MKFFLCITSNIEPYLFLLCVVNKAVGESYKGETHDHKFKSPFENFHQPIRKIAAGTQSYSLTTCER